MLFRSLKQVLFLELVFTKETYYFMYILLDIVCKWKMYFVKDYKNDWMSDIKKLVVVLHLTLQKLSKAQEEPICCYTKEYNYTLRM